MDRNKKGNLIVETPADARNAAETYELNNFQQSGHRIKSGELKKLKAIGETGDGAALPMVLSRSFTNRIIASWQADSIAPTERTIEASIRHVKAVDYLVQLNIPLRAPEIEHQGAGVS